MAQCQRSTRGMLNNVALYAVAVLLIVVPITGLPATNSAVQQPPPPPPQQQPYDLPTSFINDPFYHPTPTHHTGQNNAGSNVYHHNSGPSNPVQPSQHYNLYHYNSGAANPVPNYNNNNYQYHSSGYHNHHAAGSHHYPITTASPQVAQPAAGGSYSQTGGQEEYEAEDGRMPSAGTAAGTGGAQGYQLSAHAPAQHNFHYGNYGAGRGSNRNGGLLEAIRSPRYQYRQQPSWFNIPLFYYALNAW